MPDGVVYYYDTIIRKDSKILISNTKIKIEFLIMK